MSCPLLSATAQEKCFMDYETTHDFSLAWKQIMILSVWLNCSFNVILRLSPCLCACVYCATMGVNCCSVTLCLSHVIDTRCDGGWNLRDFYWWSSNGYQRGQWSANTLIGSRFFPWSRLRFQSNVSPVSLTAVWWWAELDEQVI